MIVTTEDAGCVRRRGRCRAIATVRHRDELEDGADRAGERVDGRDRADPHRPLRDRGAAAAQARQAADARPSACGSTSACARAAATAATSRAACRSSRSRPSSGARPGSTSPPAPRTWPAWRATARRSCSSRRRRARAGGAGAARAPAPRRPPGDPRRRVGRRGAVVVRMPGIGGTGVVTVSQIAADGGAAARDAGRPGLDQTGLAQKGGAGDLRRADRRRAPTPARRGRPAARSTCCSGSTCSARSRPRRCARSTRERTIAVVNTARDRRPRRWSPTPTRAALPLARSSPASRASTRADGALFVDAGALAEWLFGDHMPANMIMLGAAYQHGCLPLDATRRSSGRSSSTAPRWSATWPRSRGAAPRPPTRTPSPRALRRARERRAGSAGRRPAAPSAAGRRATPPSAGAELRALLTAAPPTCAPTRTPRTRAAYVDDVLAVLAAERERGGAAGDAASPRPTPAALHKLMAYKDEYEVARLHLDAVEPARRDAASSVPARAPRSCCTRRCCGRSGSSASCACGSGATPLFRGLRAGRRLRGNAARSRSAARRCAGWSASWSTSTARWSATRSCG